MLGPSGAVKTLTFSGSGYNTTLGAQQMLMQRKSCLITVIKHAQVLGSAAYMNIVWG